MSEKKYYIDQNDAFVIEDYNRQKTFASFLPAVAGLYGKPMWVYYVNRVQCVSTFGVNNKDCSIMEFEPANKAYRQVALQGFRTFLRVARNGGEAVYYEPFRDTFPANGAKQRMIITSYDLCLEDVNEELGIKTEVMFCTLPGEEVAGLVRSVKVTNISGEPLEVEVLDGMPAIIPNYLTNIDMKEMSNLRQAWMSADFVDGKPVYRIKALPYDTPETVLLEGCNFYLSFNTESGEVVVNDTITDPYLVFGTCADFAYPDPFVSGKFNVPETQVGVGYTPCGFGYRKLSLAAEQSSVTYAIIGAADSTDKYISYVERKIKPGYIEAKIAENKTVIEASKRHIFTASGSREFDLYCGQTFLDNYLRGGYPVKVGNGKHVLYVYSRKHGDLEREYNFFQVDSTNYSQGNSNFRDVNQNRRNDVYFFPYLGDSSIKTFFNLLQLDGFNPLVLTGSKFEFADADACRAIIAGAFDAAAAEDITAYAAKAFTPGGLLGYIEQRGYEVSGSVDEFLQKLLENCNKIDTADFKEGYWVDHWTYNIDLLEQFLSVFPDRAKEAVFGECDYTYYDNEEIVVDRTHRHVLTKDGVRQYNATRAVEEKAAMIKARTERKNQVRRDNGKGEVYRCTLASKIMLLLLNKIASLDPEGVGLEMEGNKPGWCDALNGLPGILGSSINESAEVGRLADMMLDIYDSIGGEILLPDEAKLFFDQVLALLRAGVDGLEYWDKSNTAKEAYRESVIFGIAGGETALCAEDIRDFLALVSARIDAGLEKAYDTESGTYFTYFINAAKDYEFVLDENGEKVLGVSGLPLVKVSTFEQRPIPVFLEGQVHVMRTRPQCSAKLHEAVKKSGLHDEKLDMFVVNANIMDETKEIGRQNVFPRGWLENEAVFLHMEYKYFLELLRSGLYDEFSHYLHTSAVPFLDPEMYGRSTLENSSFIASSAHPDERIHGEGFVSRLTGASSEFLTMWRFMTAGQKPFILNNKGELCMKLTPAIPGWLFSKEAREVEYFTGETETATLSLGENTFAFELLGSILCVYHNDALVDTWNTEVKKIELYKDGKLFATVNGGTVPAPYAERIRSGEFDRIEAYL